MQFSAKLLPNTTLVQHLPRVDIPSWEILVRHWIWLIWFSDFVNFSANLRRIYNIRQLGQMGYVIFLIYVSDHGAIGLHFNAMLLKVKCLAGLNKLKACALNLDLIRYGKAPNLRPDDKWVGNPCGYCSHLWRNVNHMVQIVKCSQHVVKTPAHCCMKHWNTLKGVGRECDLRWPNLESKQVLS